MPLNLKKVISTLTPGIPGEFQQDLKNYNNIVFWTIRLQSSTFTRYKIQLNAVLSSWSNLKIKCTSIVCVGVNFMNRSERE